MDDLSCDVEAREDNALEFVAKHVERNHPEFVAFTTAMAVKLHARRHKLDAPKLPPAALLRMLRIEVEELAVALEYQTSKDVMAEAVDVANFAMLIFKRMQGAQ